MHIELPEGLTMIKLGDSDAIEKRSLTESLGGILSHKKPNEENQDINQMVDDAFGAEVSEKYGK